MNDVYMIDNVSRKRRCRGIETISFNLQLNHFLLPRCSLFIGIGKMDRNGGKISGEFQVLL